jgi:hypothetical protein
VSRRKDDDAKKAVCVYCEHEMPCPFNVFMGKCEYPMCRLCIVEAKKDGYAWGVRK